MIVLLDSGPLGMIGNPSDTPHNTPCKAWLARMLAAGVRVMIPSVIDYEVRRELMLGGRIASVLRLDWLRENLGTVPTTDEVWVLAADLWARSRNAGQPTAAAGRLDGDVILAATALLLEQEQGDPVTVATDNLGHLSRFVAADLWSNLRPPAP